MFEVRVKWYNNDGSRSMESIIGRFHSQKVAESTLKSYEENISSVNFNWYCGGSILELREGRFIKGFHPGDVGEEGDFGLINGDFLVMKSNKKWCKVS